MAALYPWDDDTVKSKGEWVNPANKRMIAEFEAQRREQLFKTRKGRRSLGKSKFQLGSYKR